MYGTLHTYQIQYTSYVCTINRVYGTLPCYHITICSELSNPATLGNSQKCPDYWGGLISGVNLYYKPYFGTSSEWPEYSGGHISGVLIRGSSLYYQIQYTSYIITISIIHFLCTYVLSGFCPHWSAVVGSNQHSTFLTRTQTILTSTQTILTSTHLLRPINTF